MSNLQTLKKKRLSIMIEMPYLKRLLRKLEDIHVPGYTVIPAIAGLGRSSNWRADALSSDTGQMAQVLILVDEEQVEGILEAIYTTLKKQIGIVSIGDEDVIQPPDF